MRLKNRKSTIKNNNIQCLSEKPVEGNKTSTQKKKFNESMRKLEPEEKHFIYVSQSGGKLFRLLMKKN